MRQSRRRTWSPSRTPSADLAYVVYGAALHFGIDIDAAIAEVHRSNMTKVPAGDGKAIKGPSYSPPDLSSIVG